MRTIHRDIVSAVIFSSDGKILLGKTEPMCERLDLSQW